MSKKKKGIDITGAFGAFDDEYVTVPKGELGIKKKDKSLTLSFEKGKEVKKGRMFTAAEVRALDEAKEEKNYKKKDRIKSSGDKDRIKLMSSNLRRYTKGGMCPGESRGGGAAIRGKGFKGIF